VPTVWDETRGLDGKVGEYICIARRRGDVWYVGGMTDWSARIIKLPLDFLADGDYEVELYKDGANAHRAAKDYKKVTFDLSVRDGKANSDSVFMSEGLFSADMAPGGGFAARISKIKRLVFN
jgi:alpha-glucosidase